MFLVSTVAISRLYDDIFGLIENCRVIYYGAVGLADITGKNHFAASAILLDVYAYGCRPEYMARFIVTAFDIVIDTDTIQIFYGRKMRRHCFSIFHGIKRYFRVRTAAAFPFVAFGLEYSVFFL